MKQILLDITKAIVEDPDSVVVTEKNQSPFTKKGLTII